jgi:hypothetical protein
MSSDIMASTRVMRAGSSLTHCSLPRISSSHRKVIVRAGAAMVPRRIASWMASGGEQRAAAAGVVVGAGFLHVRDQDDALGRTGRAGDLRDERPIRAAMKHRLDVDVDRHRPGLQLRRQSPAHPRGRLEGERLQRVVVWNAAPLQHVGRLGRPRVRRDARRDHARGAASAHGLLPGGRQAPGDQHHRALDVLAVVARGGGPGAGIDETERGAAGHRAE